ncbi:MAG: hypothetical protein AAB074_19410 [Planctomycetota bacterium]
MAPTPLPDPASWFPPPDGVPPVEERAKNLVRHLLLILAVIAVLGLPVVLARMGRGASRGTAPAAGR